VQDVALHDVLVFADEGVLLEDGEGGVVVEVGQGGEFDEGHQ
jgi:hypothetical protein